MAKLGIFTGTSPNDNTGDTLAQGALKINSNFNEIYNAIGDGTNITNRIAFATTAGIATNVIGGIASVTTFSASGIATVLSSNLKIRNSGNTFQYSIAASAITADRTISLPLITGSDTLAVLGLPQTFSGISTFGNAFTLSQTTQNIDLGSTQTTGTWTAGGTNQTGSITLGVSTASQTVNIASGIGLTTTTKTINIGTGSTGITRINVGSSSTIGIGTFVINSRMNVGIGSTIPEYTLDVSGDIRATGVFYGNVSGNVNNASYATTSINIIGGIGSMSSFQVSGISTLGVTSTTNLTVEQLYVSGISTLGVTSTTNFTSRQLTISGISTLGVTSTTNLTTQQLIVSGISTFSSGPILIARTTSTGTSNQLLQVQGGAYISSNLGIGTTSPTSTLSVNGSTVIGTEILDMTGLSSSFISDGSFVVPVGVTKISAVLIGGGGAGGGGSAGGSGSGGQGGGGGGLRYINDLSVTPGETLTVVVGTGGVGASGAGGNGGSSQIKRSATILVEATGGTGGANNSSGLIGTGGSGTTVSGNIGGSSGGNGGTASLTLGAGGGGSAGYSGNGGAGGNNLQSGSAGLGGAASGGGAPSASGSGGGGVGVLGQGTSGSSSAGVGNGGSGGSTGSLGNSNNGATGGLYGGGGGGGDGNAGTVTTGGNGAQGIVRIIWIPQSKFSRTFPTSQVGNTINQ